jgi:hypothetical protein
MALGLTTFMSTEATSILLTSSNTFVAVKLLVMEFPLGFLSLFTHDIDEVEYTSSPKSSSKTCVVDLQGLRISCTLQLRIVSCSCCDTKFQLHKQYNQIGKLGFGLIICSDQAFDRSSLQQKCRHWTTIDHIQKTSLEPEVNGKKKQFFFLTMSSSFFLSSFSFCWTASFLPAGASAPTSRFSSKSPSALPFSLGSCAMAAATMDQFSQGGGRWKAQEAESVWLERCGILNSWYVQRCSHKELLFGFCSSLALVGTCIAFVALSEIGTSALSKIYSFVFDLFW